MNLAMNMKKSGFCGVLLSMTFFLFGTVSHATSLDDALKTDEEQFFRGLIMEVHKDYLVVSEKIVLLVDEKRYGRAYETLIMDLNGKPQSFQSLAVGSRIFIKAFVPRERGSEKGKLVAREIYLLPKSFGTRDMEGNTLLNSPISPW